MNAHASRASLKSLADAPEFPLTPSDDVHIMMTALRERSPLARTAVGMVLALRHRHLALVTSDATRQLETEALALQGVFDGPIFELIDTVMLFSNGETHQRRRTPVSRTFAFKLMDAMRSRVAALTAELVQPRIGAGPIDFVNEIAARIPARIIADVLGIPRSDLPVFMHWIADTGQALGFFDPERRAEIEASLIAFNAYVADLLAERRANPRGDFLSDYVAATAREGVLTEAEIRIQVLGLILAGSDTTRGSLCMTLAHLLAHRDQWRAFRADPDGLKGAVVNEGLRYDPIVSGLPRVALRDLELDGYHVPAGTPIAVSLISALRDPDVYAAPDSFDIFRTDHPRWHPIFGAGPHRCVGEALARAEMEEVLAAIARLAPNTELVGDFPTLSSGALRQVSAMRVTFAQKSVGLS